MINRLQAASIGACSEKCPNSVLIVKVLVGAFNNEKVIVKTSQTF